MQRLLIVEDDASVRSTMVTCLELEGYNVDAVSSTHEAIRKLESESYPIVISDIYLDEKTGIEGAAHRAAAKSRCAVI
jgi:CheY-like chemotaxis protein